MLHCNTLRVRVGVEANIKEKYCKTLLVQVFTEEKEREKEKDLGYPLKANPQTARKVGMPIVGGVDSHPIVEVS